MGNFQQFGFNRDDDGISATKKRFKGQEGMRYRVSFAWWKGAGDGDLNMDEETCEFVGAQRNYVQGAGYVINRGPEYTKIAGEPPRMAIGTVIIVWPQDSKGKLDKNAIANGDVDVLPWIFSQDKYKALEPLHTEFHFGKHDVNITCTDSNYQKMTFAPCKESLLRKFKDKGGSIYSNLVEEVAMVAASIQGHIGREYSLDDLRQKLAGGAGGAGGSGGNSATSPAVATEDIDNLVDDLLDD